MNDSVSAFNPYPVPSQHFLLLGHHISATTSLSDFTPVSALDYPNFRTPLHIDYAIYIILGDSPTACALSRGDRLSRDAIM